MQEQVNLRYKDGALRPINPVKLFGVAESFPDYVGTAHIHPINAVYHAIVSYDNVTTGHIKAKIFKNGVYSSAQTIKSSYTTGLENTVQWVHMGNFLILLIPALYISYTFFFDLTNEQYIDVGLLPDIIELKYTGEASSGDDLEYDWSSLPTEVEINEQANNLISEMQANSIPTGYVMVSHAYELWDGTLLRTSPPIGVRTSRFSYNGVTYTLTLNAYKLQYRIMTGDSDLNALRTSWGKLIKGIRFFISPPSAYDGDATSLGFKFLTPDLVPAMYQANAISLDEMDYDDTGFVEVNNFNTVAALPMMMPDNTYITQSGNCSLLYNNRLIYGDVLNQFWQGWDVKDLHAYMTADDDGNYSVVLEVDILTDQGLKTVSVERVLNYRNSTHNEHFRFYGATYTPDNNSSWACYPDARAKVMRVIVHSGSTYYLVGTTRLRPHPFYNYSWGYFLTDYEASGSDWSAYPTTSLATVNDKHNDTNRIQASENGNPLIFPPSKSYRVSFNEVVALSVNTRPISEGQYGQHPILAFTNGGLYAMTISTREDLFVENIVPLGRNVCTNRNSVLQTDFGIVFQCADGVFLFDGANMVEISQSAEGSTTIPIASLSQYTTLVADTNVVSANVKDALTSAFSTFLASGKFGYNYMEGELHISNTSVSVKYSWCFSFRSRQWFVRERGYSYYIHHYPKMLGVSYNSDGKLYDLTTEETTGTGPSYLLISRPIKLVHDRLKKIHGAALRGYIKMITGGTYKTVFQMYGSTDGITWVFLTSNEPTAVCQDIRLSRSLHSCQYFIFVMGGYANIDNLLNITHVDVIFEEKWTNKIR